MAKDLNIELRAYKKKHKQRKAWHKLLWVLGCLTVFCTTYALILPAITMGDTTYCGVEEHTHSVEAGCYEKTLICGLEESGGHQHSDSCWEKTLTCQQAEHTHSLACYSNPEADVETAADWEKTLEDVELTGDPIEDLLAIAETQTGYRESTENYIVLEDGVTIQGYTRYGHWYSGGGENMDFAYEDWCAMFVSFCLHYAEIPTEVFPQMASCSDWVAELEEMGLYQAVAEPENAESAESVETVNSLEGAGSGDSGEAEAAFVPQEGDLVFFDYADEFGQRDGLADHVGIVSGRVLDYENETEDGYYPVTGIKTIEGDSADAVAERKYAINDADILGYGVMPVEESGLDALAEKTYTRMEENTVSLSAFYCTYDNTATTSEKVGYYVRNAVSDTRIPAESVYQEDGSLVEAVSGGDNVTRFDNAFYLIPVSYFKENYAQYGYTFDPATDADTCPIFYTDSYPEATYSSNSAYLHMATYYELDGEWYVRVKGIDNNGWVCYVYYAYLQVARDTVSPSSTVIHMFDYWTTSARTFSDNHASTSYDMEGGINAGHALKFGKNIPSTATTGYGDINYSWGGTSTPSRVTQGIVLPNLGGDGYPQFSGASGNSQRKTTSIDQYLISEGDSAETIAAKQESFAYLFDPKTELTNGKVTFTKVTGLLWRNEQGYFCFDSEERGVELDENTHTITEYTTPVGYYYANEQVQRNGQFFPFNDAHQTVLNDAAKDPSNHYFGMTLTTRFIQQYDGFTTSKRDQAMKFEFSGDNDVWIYIDGVLVADLGGLRSAASVSIDFSTGIVSITDGATNPQTTILQAFINAGKNVTTGFSGNTFSDNTTHTLKFYYLERGNYDSNLRLQYNLNEIPPTSIYKVNQYGKKITGAGFAVYTTDKDYKYAVDGGSYAAWSDNWQIDAGTGQVYTLNEDGSRNVVITKPAYVGVTDSGGDMVFVDEDGMPYSISELEEKLGEYFILREISVPAGYRTVTDEVKLRIDGSVIACDDSYKSGVWASPNAQVTATNELHVSDAYQTVLKDADNKAVTQIDYYDPSTDQGANGTLFAVVLKRNGLSLSQIDSWYPVYGSDEVGYTVVGENGAYTDTVTGEDGVKTTITYGSQIEAVIAAAQNAQQYGNTIFQYSASGMQVTLENLPGKPERYYTYMQQQNGGELLQDGDGVTTGLDPQYFVAYYWTNGKLADANKNNTVRVVSRNGIVDKYTGFSIQWGTTIEVPNLENRLFVQKLDTAGELVNGATFALYEVYDATPRTESGISYGYNYIYYNGTDAGGNAVWVGLLDNSATPQPGRAIVFGGGTADTHVLGRGDYTTDKVTGVITVTLDTLGSRGDAKVGDTYTVCPATNANGDTLITTSHDECSYVKEKGTGHFDHLKSGKYYLREISAPAGYTENTAEVPVLVNENGVYANAGDADNNVTVGNGVGYLTKTLDVFASQGEIDETLSWVYGALIENDAKDFSAFDAVSGDVIYVGDGSSTTSDKWHFVKQSGDDPDGYGTGESDNRSEAMVTYLYYDGALASSQTSSALFDYSPNTDQGARSAAGKKGVATLSGEGTRRLYTDSGWSDMAIYQDYAYGTSQITTGSTTNYDDLTAYGNISNLFSSSTFVQVTDERAADLVVKKVDMANENTLLSGAQFRLYRLETVTVEAGSESEPETKTIRTYYSWSDSGAVQWVEDETQATVVSTETDGLGKVFSSLKDGSYYLEEIQAPDGYNLLSSAVELKVSGGKITVPNAGTSGISVDGGILDEAANRYVYTITIPNSTGYELPATGGMGTAAIYLFGILFVMGAGALLVLRKRAAR